MREAQEKEKAEKQRKLLQVISGWNDFIQNFTAKNFRSIEIQEKEQRSKEKAQQKMQEDLMRVQEQKRREAEREQKRKYVIKQMFQTPYHVHRAT